MENVLKHVHTHVHTHKHMTSHIQKLLNMFFLKVNPILAISQVPTISKFRSVWINFIPGIQGIYSIILKGMSSQKLTKWTAVCENDKSMTQVEHILKQLLVELLIKCTLPVFVIFKEINFLRGQSVVAHAFSMVTFCTWNARLADLWDQLVMHSETVSTTTIKQKSKKIQIINIEVD